MGKTAPCPFFVQATSQSPGLPETLATAYNPGMCLLALPVIDTAKIKGQEERQQVMKLSAEQKERVEELLAQMTLEEKSRTDESGIPVHRRRIRRAV